MASPTTFKGYTYPAHGGAVNAWDTPINADFDQIDLNLGGSYNVTYYSSVVAAPTFNSTYAVAPSTGTTVTLLTSIAQNLHYNVSGTFSGNQSIVWPSGLGAIFDVTNGSSGAFSLTLTPAGGGSTYTVAQGGSSILISDGTNIILADSNEAAAQFYTYLGNPNGNRAGNAGNTNGAATDATWDGTNQILYIATQTGNAATTVWTPQLGKLVPQGYLTNSTDNNNPIITSDQTQTYVNYVPYEGDWTILSNGTAIYPYQFSAMNLTLTNSQSASGIYDIFMYANPTVGIISPVIGVGPVWSVTTAGSCSRGIGAGTTQLARFLGIWTNAVTMNLTYNTGSGNVTVSVGANQGIYLGSIFIDTVAGQVTCNVGYGQSRKWGIFNAYNRVPVYLKGGDSTGSWNYNTNTWRPSNNNSANTVTIFMGLPEERMDIKFQQKMSASGSPVIASIGIGINSTTVPTGLQGVMDATAAVAGIQGQAEYFSAPSLGINVYTMLENALQNTSTLQGTETNMIMSANWRA